MEELIKVVNRIATDINILTSDASTVKVATINGIITLFATVFATAFGGWLTIQLFKRQEMMRIKEELRLDFFKEYSKQYKKIYEDLLLIISELDRLESAKSSMEFSSKVEQYIENMNLYKLNASKKLMSRSISTSESVLAKLKNINYFIKSKKIIYGNMHSPYEDIYIRFRDIATVFTHLKFVEKDIDEMIHREVTSEEIKEHKKFMLTCDIDSHNEVLNKVFKLKGNIETIAKELDLINQKIEENYLGVYFKENVYLLNEGIYNNDMVDIYNEIESLI